MRQNSCGVKGLFWDSARQQYRIDIRGTHRHQEKLPRGTSLTDARERARDVLNKIAMEKPLNVRAPVSKRTGGVHYGKLKTIHGPIAPNPTALLPLDMYEPLRGVYFLIVKGAVVYVGQSVDIRARVSAHIRERKKLKRPAVDSVVWFHVPESGLSSRYASIQDALSLNAAEALCIQACLETFGDLENSVRPRMGELDERKVYWEKQLGLFWLKQVLALISL